jgi:diacylglycerol kinase (ATP)
VKKGARLIFVWGGDGMVQRCIDALANEKDVELAILPAGTANLLATNLGIPKQIARAVRVGLHGARHTLDVGVMNGERFAVMAGAGFDAIVMSSVDTARKKQLGRLAYFRGGVRAMRAKAVPTKVRVDGATWFDGAASAVLIGNVGTVTGGFKVFPNASDDDGLLEVGVVTAHSVWQWLRVLSRVAGGRPDVSKFVKVTRGAKIVVRMSRKRVYQIDGGVRSAAKCLKVRVDPGAITVRVPPVRRALGRRDRAGVARSEPARSDGHARRARGAADAHGR